MTNPYGTMPPPPPQEGYGYPGEPQRGPRPSSVENAVRLMWLTAAFSLIGIIVTFTTKSDLRKRIEQSNPSADSQRLDHLLNIAIGIGLFFAAAILVLYVLLALQVRKGRNWARIVTWVFAGLGVLGALKPLAATVTPVSRVLSLVQGVIDIAIIVLLAQASSNAYFKPRY